MRDIELEEGEAYFFHDDDDDENIDPDRDFSYIDKKIENVLGHYQKDFMGGLSAESLGARFGGYGSFLPMQQRSPSVLSEQRSQSHVSSKSPQNPPSGQSHPNPTGVANISIPVKPLTGSSANGARAVSESGALSLNNQLKVQDASGSASIKQQKEPMPQYSKQNSLKLRVKMPAENALPYDKSAIYSGLGLDISPSSSPEDSQSDSDHASPGVQMKTESPSYIVEIMTTLPLPNDELLSPLHDSLAHLTLKENHEVNNGRGNNCSQGKKEVSNGKKSKVKDSLKDRKIKKELRKERKLKEAQNVSHVELMTGNRENPVKASVLAINGKDNVSVAPIGVVNARSGERELTGSKPSVYDKKNTVRSLEDNISSSMQQLRVNKKNEAQKQQGSAKDKVKEGILGTVGPKPGKVYRKGYEMAETASIDKEAGLFSKNDVVGNDKHDGTYEEMKDCNTPKLSKQKTHVKVEAGVFSGKKKSWENQTDGRCSEEPPRESLVVGPSAAEIGVVKGSIPPKSKKDESDLRKEIKKDDKVPTNVGSNKKGKETSFKDFEKEKSSFKRKEITAPVVPNIAGGLIGGNSVENMPMPVVNLAPAEIVPHDDWVQCDKCHKWRLLPLGMDPESLPKVWKCSMLTWLPGKNKCSVSEEETNAVYQPPGLTQLQNNQLAYPDVGAFVGASGGIPHVGISTQTSNIDTTASGSKRRDLLKTDLDAAKRNGFQDSIPPKNDQLYSGEFGSQNPKKLSRDPNAARKSGDPKPSKLERKREADFDASRVPKKMKRVHQPSSGNLDPTEAKGENENVLGPLEIAQDYVKKPLKTSHVGVKDRTQNSMIAKNSEIKDSGKKRKLKDRAESTTSLEYRPRVEHQMKNDVEGKNGVSEPREERKERKSKGSKFQGREGSADKTNSRTHSDGGKHNRDSSSDNSRHKRGRRNNTPLEERHADKGSQRISNVRNSTEKALDFGLSDNATTSSSSKVSCKRKAKASEVKCSPIGSISSSPFRLSKCDSDKGTSKVPASYKESDELSSSKQLKSRAEGVSHEFPTHAEEIRDRKSNLSRSYGAATAVVNKPTRNKSAGKHPGPHITEDSKDASYKLDHVIEDGEASASRHNLVSGDHVAKSSNRLRIGEANSRRMKVHDPPIGSEKETSFHSYGVPENEQANGSYATNVDNVSLRHTQATAQSSDIESSVKGSSHRAAKTALKEATNLKHSANRLKISGSTIESTEVFFQAALKFLHGASLMEPGYNESARGGEMASTEVYSTTATLCEYCAREYERGNNLASAALAYKCMEVAYMRVVYCNDVVASRDRMELQMAIRTAPQMESPSSSASDVDNLNNQAATDPMKDGHSALDHRAHVISAENRPSFSRLLNFTEDINRAMEASRRSQIAVGAATPILMQAGKQAGISCIKTVLDFSFHDVEGFLHLVRLAMEALGGN